MFSAPHSGVSASHLSHLTRTSSQFNLSHRRLVLRFEVAIESHVLVDRQGLPPGMPRDQLKLGISQARVPGQPGDRLVPEGVRGRLDPRLLGVLGDDLLDPPRAELAMPLGLEEPAVVRVGGDVRSQGRGEGLAEEDVAILGALALVDPDLAGFEINVGDSECCRVR